MSKLREELNELIGLNTNIAFISEMTKDIYNKSKKMNDEKLINKVRNNMKELNELRNRRNHILQKAHEKFETYKTGLLRHKNFDPVENNIIEKIADDDMLLSALEGEYQNKRFDKNFDIEYWRMISGNKVYWFLASSIEVLEVYMTHTSKSDINYELIRYVLEYVPHEEHFALGVCILNDLDYIIPEDLWPKSISEDIFNKWFAKNRPNVPKEKIRKLIH